MLIEYTKERIKHYEYVRDYKAPEHYEYFNDLVVYFQAKLDELYDLKYGALLRDSMEFHREQQELLMTM